MSSLASCWCFEGVGLQVTFEETLGWLSSDEGVMHSRQQERHTRSLCWWRMICELVDVVEWWKMNEDQMHGGGEGGVGDRVGWMSREFVMSWGRFWRWCDYGSVASAVKEHLRTHQIHINRGLLDDNTEILHTECCPSRLKLYEALFISREKPRINMQKDFTDGTLSLFNCVSSHQSQYEGWHQ